MSSTGLMTSERRHGGRDQDRGEPQSTISWLRNALGIVYWNRTSHSENPFFFSLLEEHQPDGSTDTLVWKRSADLYQ